MLTPFGQFVRKKRIDKFITLKDMAEELGVSSAFLSAVEMGKKRVPEDWTSKISTYLELSSDEKKELLNFIDQSRKTLKIDLEGFSPKRRETFFAFARKFQDLSPEDMKKLQAFFENVEEREK